MKHIPYSLVVGTDLKSFSNLKTTYAALSSEFEFLMLPVVHPLQYRSKTIEDHRSLPLTFSDTLLRSIDWARIIGKVSENFIDCDSPFENIRSVSEHIFAQELQLAFHYGLRGILLPALKASNINFARILSQYYAKELAFFVQSALDNESWERYQQLKQLCGTAINLKLCLELEEDIPAEGAALERWKAEDIGMIRIKFNVFQTTEKGSPMLSKAHQAFLHNFFPFCSKIVIQGQNPLDNLVKYKKHLFYVFKEQSPYSENNILDYNYRDYLQAPLQPLMNNLEAVSYETFENDKKKYELYSAALSKAFSDFRNYGKFVPDGIYPKIPMPCSEPLRVLVVGAGRGPLIRCAFEASKKTKVKIFVSAIEKNINAVITLKNLQFQEKWGKRLTIISEDIRTYSTKESFDIIVSELLGSFGDNELSPECLDGAQKLLKERGIYIPHKYASYLRPINSHILHAQLKGQGLPNPFEIPYVSYIFSTCYLGAPAQVFEYRHPKPEGASNTRFTVLKFPYKEMHRNLVHGFAGYFDSTLYQDIHNCTVPNMHTDDLHSWFPIYFPIRDPLWVSPGDTICVNVWRCENSLNVWYEWAIEISSRSGISTHTPIHNSKGQFYSIGLH